MLGKFVVLVVGHASSEASRPVPQVRRRPEERVLLVAARRRRVGARRSKPSRSFPGGELAPAVVVFERHDGLTDADKQRINEHASEAQREPPRRRPRGTGAGLLAQRQGGADRPARPARRRRRATASRTACSRSATAPASQRDGLEVKLTGAAGYSLDAIKVFGGVNGPLLLAAASIVLVLLIVIYRSPIFWMIPFFAVVLAEGASRGAGYLLAEAGVTINGQTGGILPVLVFGAGTDYALLLVSRYREELRQHEDKHEAMAIALRSAGPAILASGLTVIAALLTLIARRGQLDGRASARSARSASRWR